MSATTILLIAGGLAALIVFAWKAGRDAERQIRRDLELQRLAEQFDPPHQQSCVLVYKSPPATLHTSRRHDPRSCTSREYR